MAVELIWICDRCGKRTPPVKVESVDVLFGYDEEVAPYFYDTRPDDWTIGRSPSHRNSNFYEKHPNSIPFGWLVCAECAAYYRSLANG